MKPRTSKELLQSEISLLPSKSTGWKIRCAAVFPSDYSAAMSNLGFQTLFEKMHNFQMFYPQRFFANLKSGSLEEKKPLSSFQLIMVSLSYELDYFNILKMFKYYGIAPNRKHRHRDRIVIAGGAAPSINPYPISLIADAIFIGEGGDCIENIIEVLSNNPPGFTDKSIILKELSLIPGLWVPELQDKPPEKALSNVNIPSVTTILSSFASFPNIVLVQIQRGCASNCPFCATPVTFNPFYNYSADSVLKQLHRWEIFPKRIGLIGSAIADYPQLTKLFEYLRDSEIYTSSIRIDRLNSQCLNVLKLSKHRTMTFAPETGAQRLKAELGKIITPEDIIAVSSQLPASTIKLYYIIGLPSESIKDVQETIEEISFVAKSLSKKKFTISVNAFVPKRNTLLENCSMMPHDELTKRFELIKSGLRNIPNLRLDINYKRKSRAQWVLSCGGKDIANVLVNCKSTSDFLRNCRANGWDV
jgi:radical SAM superfamily enzyme YgiQ (UPF0313 family)